MNKRGQVYILAAIILSIAIFILAKKVNTTQQESIKDDFEKLSENYERESIRFINYLLLSQQENFIQNSFLNFTFLFTSYSKTQNPNFGLIYVFDFHDNLQIGNFLSESVFVDNGTEDYVEINGCFEAIPAVIQFQGLSFTSDVLDKEIRKCTKTFDSKNKKEVWMRIGTYWYPITITKNKPQIVIVSKQEAQEQRKVFVGGDEDTYLKEDQEKPKKLSDLCSEVDPLDSKFYTDFCEETNGEKFKIKNCKKITDPETCYIENCEWKGNKCK